MNRPDFQLGRVALSGGLLTGLAQAIKIAVSFISVVVMARLLVPEDFGLVASISPLLAFVGLFSNLGLQQAIVQRPTITHDHLNQLFWITMLVGVVASAIVIASAPLAAGFYGDERIRGLMMLAAVPMLLGGLSAVPLSLLNRNLRFGALALNEVLIAVGGFLCAVIAALAGLGYWSLIIGGIGSAVISVLAAWRAAPWMPGRPTLRVQSELLSFGMNLTGFNLVNFFSRHLDTILIGRFAGIEPLGYYDRAYKLLMFPLQNVSQPLSRLMLPLLSRIQQDKPRFRSVYLQTNWALGLLMMPGIAAATMTAHEVIGLFFGERWLPVAPIFAWLGIAGFSQVVTTTNGWIFICQGRTKEMFRTGIFTAATTIASFIVGLQWGVVGLAAAYAITAYTLRIPVLVAVLHRIGPVRAGDFAAILLVFGAAAGLSWTALEFLVKPLLAGHNLGTLVAAGAINYIFALACVLTYKPSREVLRTTFRSLQRALAQRADRKG